MRSNAAQTGSAPLLSTAQILRRLALDTVLWYLAPILFLLVYTFGYAGTAAAAGYHCLVVGMPFAAVLLARLALSCIPRGGLVRTAAATLVLWSGLALLLVYYALVVVGLHSWGGIVAWNVIPSFFAEGPQLLDAVGLSQAAAEGLIALLFAGLFAGCWTYLRRFDWTEAAARRMSGLVLWALVLCGTGCLFAAAYQFSFQPWTDVGEPVSLTLYPQAGVRDLEGHSLNPRVAQRYDTLDKAARAAYVRAGPATRRNLILIVVDALRPDHMGIYGYSRDTTPNLSRLSRSGKVTVVQRMHASCGDTICGLLSLSTAKFPHEFSYHPFTLQEALRRNGYRVHMILSGDHTYFYSLKSFYGPVDSFFDGTQAHGWFMNDDEFLVDRIAHLPAFDGTPSMFQFHLMSAHILRKAEQTPGPFQPAERYLFHSSRDLGPEDHPVLTATNFYDNGVVKADSIIQELLRALELKGYLHNALVVITADHGEGLGEHGLFQHANSVREQLLRIPLVMISYGDRTAEPVRPHGFPSQVDIAPTLLTALGLPLPRTWSGRPLQEPDNPEFTFFEEGSYFGILDHRDPGAVWKYWKDIDSGSAHAFDLTADPAERRDAAQQIPAPQRRLWDLLALSGASPLGR